MANQAKANLDSLRRALQRMVDDEQEQGGGRGAEKRRHHRHLCMIEARMKYVKRFERVSDCPDEFTTITKDLSRSGLSFIHEHQMYTGEIVQVELAVMGVTKVLLMKIIRCRRAGLRVFDIAGEFISPEEARTGAPEPPKKSEKD